MTVWISVLFLTPATLTCVLNILYVPCMSFYVVKFTVSFYGRDELLLCILFSRISRFVAGAHFWVMDLML